MFGGFSADFMLWNVVSPLTYSMMSVLFGLVLVFCFCKSAKETRRNYRAKRQAKLNKKCSNNRINRKIKKTPKKCVRMLGLSNTEKGK